MLYWLIEFADKLSFLNVFRYITFRTGGAMMTALVQGQASPEALMALGFQNLADNAAKIGEFNFSPDLLRQLARDKG